MADKPSEYDPFERLNKLQHTLRQEDDRTVLLLTSAYLEDLLGRLLIAYLMDVKVATKLVDGFDAPLGTFSARIRAAYAMGLVTEVQYTDLELLRKARNTMAHSWEMVSLQTPEVADRIRRMSDTKSA